MAASRYPEISCRRLATSLLLKVEVLPPADVLLAAELTDVMAGFFTSVELETSEENQTYY